MEQIKLSDTKPDSCGLILKASLVDSPGETGSKASIRLQRSDPPTQDADAV